MNEDFGTYLNDHLAGSIAAVALIDDLLAGELDLPLKAVLARVRREIAEEQEVVRKVMAATAIREGTVKQGMAWLGEKLSRWKIGNKVPEGSCLPLMQALEVLYLGITGKLLGWHVLAAVLGSKLAELGIDIRSLEQRAIAQRDSIEQHRLHYAAKTFGASNTV